MYQLKLLITDKTGCCFTHNSDKLYKWDHSEVMCCIRDILWCTCICI